MVESDAPWCEIRPSHASHSLIQTKVRGVAKEKYNPDFMVKSRNEPIASLQVLEILSALHKLPIEDLAKVIYGNTLKVFF